MPARPKTTLTSRPLVLFRIDMEQLSSLSLLQASHHQQQRRSSESLLVNIYSTEPSLLLPTANHRASFPSSSTGFPSVPCRSWVPNQEKEESSSSSGLVFQRADAFRGAQAATSNVKEKEVPKGIELFPLRISGPTENRVNVAFFGDGCESLSLYLLSFPFLSFFAVKLRP